MTNVIDWQKLSVLERNKIIHAEVMGQDTSLCQSVMFVYDDDGRRFCYECGSVYFPGEKPHARPIPPYSTSMDAAWQIVKHFASLPDEPFEERFKKQFFMSALDLTPSCTHPYYDMELSWLGALTPERICIAALKAVGVEVA